MDFEMDDCGGCQTCEIACSYKHTGEFNNRVSSIEIVELKDKPGYSVRITHDSSGERIMCDGCQDVDGDPLCVEFCPKREELIEIIDQFVSQCLEK
ncbi:hypothetical protein KQH56_02310 [bacterium]|nr:hypothetical protein [bacterium]